MEPLHLALWIKFQYFLFFFHRCFFKTYHNPNIESWSHSRSQNKAQTKQSSWSFPLLLTLTLRLLFRVFLTLPPSRRLWCFSPASCLLAILLGKLFPACRHSWQWVGRKIKRRWNLNLSSLLLVSSSDHTLVWGGGWNQRHREGFRLSVLCNSKVRFSVHCNSGGAGLDVPGASGVDWLSSSVSLSLQHRL